MSIFTNEYQINYQRIICRKIINQDLKYVGIVAASAINLVLNTENNQANFFSSLLLGEAIGIILGIAIEFQLPYINYLLIFQRMQKQDFCSKLKTTKYEVQLLDSIVGDRITSIEKYMQNKASFVDENCQFFHSSLTKALSNIKKLNTLKDYGVFYVQEHRWQMFETLTQLVDAKHFQRNCLLKESFVFEPDYTESWESSILSPLVVPVLKYFYYNSDSYHNLKKDLDMPIELVNSIHNKLTFIGENYKEYVDINL